MYNNFHFLDNTSPTKETEDFRFHQNYHRFLLGSITMLVWLLMGSSLAKAYTEQETRDTTHIIIVVSSIPSSAQVFLDSVYEGSSPLSIISDRKHKHLLSLELPNYVTYSQWISPRTDTVNFSIALKPNYSWLKIKTIPVDNRILIDDTLSISPQWTTRIPVGRHSLKFENYQSGRSIECQVNVSPADTICLQTTLGATSIKPVVLSILIPGAGQFYDHARLQGIGFFLGTIAAIYIGTQASKDHETASNEYQDLYASYLNASNEEAASRLRSETLSQLDKMNSSARRKNWSFGIAAGFYTANLVDVILLHRLDDFIEFKPDFSNVSLSPLVSVDLNHLQLGVIFNF